jgi:protein-tyrosine-phosphatase
MNILFLCTGNSARSLIAEAVLNRRAKGRMTAFSAGSQPRGTPHPVALETLAAAGFETATLSSKSWDQFTGDDAIAVDVVITLCDAAAAESCPIWNGAPRSLHWGLPDPAVVSEPVACREAFAATLGEIEQRVAAFIRAEQNLR